MSISGLPVRVAHGPRAISGAERYAISGRNTTDTTVNTVAVQSLGREVVLACAYLYFLNGYKVAACFLQTAAPEVRGNCHRLDVRPDTTAWTIAVGASKIKGT